MDAQRRALDVLIVEFQFNAPVFLLALDPIVRAVVGNFDGLFGPMLEQQVART